MGRVASCCRRPPVRGRLFRCCRVPCEAPLPAEARRAEEALCAAHSCRRPRSAARRPRSAARCSCRSRRRFSRRRRLLLVSPPPPFPRCSCRPRSCGGGVCGGLGPSAPTSAACGSAAASAAASAASAASSTARSVETLEPPPEAVSDAELLPAPPRLLGPGCEASPILVPRAGWIGLLPRRRPAPAPGAGRCRPCPRRRLAPVTRRRLAVAGRRTRRCFLLVFLATARRMRRPPRSPRSSCPPSGARPLGHARAPAACEVARGCSCARADLAFCFGVVPTARRPLGGERGDRCGDASPRARKRPGRPAPAARSPPRRPASRRPAAAPGLAALWARRRRARELVVLLSLLLLEELLYSDALSLEDGRPCGRRRIVPLRLAVALVPPSWALRSSESPP
mmetsp:Transcript_99602/g.286120  ORF Transcript_99602/g.286120 Transcript_99602/m.286120 type:complete len:397 (+) Transcript_99602:152-1342(+)